MTETQTNCTVCGKQVAEINGKKIHIGGGEAMQVCRSFTCGWKGGGVEKFSVCPACGDATSLSVDHLAQ